MAYSYVGSNMPEAPYDHWKVFTEDDLADQVGMGKVKKAAQSCATLGDPMDYTVRGIFQARILEWVAFPVSRGSSQPRDLTQVSRIAGEFFTSWTTREIPLIGYNPI